MIENPVAKPSNSEEVPGSNLSDDGIKSLGAKGIEKLSDQLSEELSDLQERITKFGKKIGGSLSFDPLKKLELEEMIERRSKYRAQLMRVGEIHKKLEE